MDSFKQIAGIAMLLLGLGATASWTTNVWNSRASKPAASIDQHGSTLSFESWRLETSANAPALLQVIDTPYWIPTRSARVTTSTTIIAQAMPVTLKNDGAQIQLAPYSSIQIIYATDGSSTVELLRGFANVAGPLNLALADGVNTIEAGKKLAIEMAKDSSQALVLAENQLLRPHAGEFVDQSTNSEVTIEALAESIAGPGAYTLEFAREPLFRTVLFTETVSTREPSFRFNLEDRAPGAWFVRLRNSPGEQSMSKVVAVTHFILIPSKLPDMLSLRGSRWLAWRDRSGASQYRIEFSKTEDFAKVEVSTQQRHTELDLTKAPEGRSFVRIVSIMPDETEAVGRPLSVDVKPREALLRASREPFDAELKLEARGWKIHLSEGEMRRIRDGYVILRESELRGIRIGSTVEPSNVIFEVSRDDSFANPERVRPDASGELLPPALPLGVTFARVRKLENDGSLGPYGPASRLTTLLPSPSAKAAKSTLVGETPGFELQWSLATEVAGYELRLSEDGSFAAESTKTIRTRASTRKVAAPGLEKFFWTVAAINEQGRVISQEIGRAHV